MWLGLQQIRARRLKEMTAAEEAVRVRMGFSVS
jgi:hypothetical protein